MVIEESIHINTSAQTLFDIYQDVSRWNQWDPDTKASSLDGPFAVGATGRLIPAKGHGVVMTLSALVPERSFTVEAGIPLFHMKFEHELIPQESGTRVVHRVTFSGALNFVLGENRRQTGARRTADNDALAQNLCRNHAAQVSQPPCMTERGLSLIFTDRNGSAFQNLPERALKQRSEQAREAKG